MKFPLLVVEDLKDLCRRVLGVRLLSIKTYLGYLSMFHDLSDLMKFYKVGVTLIYFY